MIKTNLKKKIVSIVLVMLMVVTMAACGSETSTTSNEATINENASTGSDAVASIENAGSNETQDVAAVEETSVEETKEASYIEHDSYYEDANFDWSGDIVLTTSDDDHDIKFTSADNSAYAIYDSVDLYVINGKVMGYTKENIWGFLTATADDWYCLTIDDKTFFVKASDFEGNNALLNASNMDYDGNYIIPEKGSTTTSNETTSTSNNITSNEATTSKETNTASNATTSETSTNTSNIAITTNEVESQVVEVSDKYTPDEAVAVWRSILEANGMTWDPSIKEFASWGTGWLELKKGKPEETAQMDLKGYAYGDGGGHPKTKYYIEVTGYDDNKVYMTSWSCS